MSTFPPENSILKVFHTLGSATPASYVLEHTHGMKSQQCDSIFPKDGSDKVASEQAVHAAPDHPYSVYTGRQKICISWLASLSAMYSGLSSFIYYPAITALSRSLSVSVEKINLTITSYQVVSGIAPAILGDLADQIGRRPICLIAFVLYFSANLGLALQHRYAALVALRCLQSAGSSSE